MPRRRWVFATLLLLLWPVLWLLFWQLYLFETLEPSSAPGVSAFAYGGSRSLDLYVVTGLAIGSLLLSVALVAIGTVVWVELKKWGALFVTAGAVLGLVALSVPVLLPQVEGVVIDEVAGEVALQTRWLYWEERDAIEFADIDRIQLRKWNLWHGQQCLKYVSLRVIANDRAVVAMPEGLRTETMLTAIVEAAHAAPSQIEKVVNESQC